MMNLTTPGVPSASPPQRPGLLRWLRRRLRGAVFRFLGKLSETEEARALGARTLAGLLNWKPSFEPSENGAFAAPYADLGKASAAGRPCQRGDVVLITGRFRSGSTLLWNLFRHVDGCVAYYEPLNERRWFDPALRGSRTDPTHRQVEDYWTEYDGLSELATLYREEWTEHHFFMDADFWEPDLKKYVEALIDRARGRPVLQFNRIDLRLPWFRRHFPAAKIVHLYRHPRDQWYSSLLGATSFGKNGSIADFRPHDGFYLLRWARDLRFHFPFLDERCVSHPYELFYYIWKLSYLFGRAYADHSLAFEDLLQDPAVRLRELFRVLAIERYDLDRLLSLITPPSVGKWNAYAPDEWFQAKEAACETVLADFLNWAE